MDRPLPGSVQELADVVGRHNALLLAGRQRRENKESIHIPSPRHMTADHWISKTIGIDAAMVLSREFAGITLHVSKCSYLYMGFRNRSIREHVRSGRSLVEVAETFGLTLRHIRNIVGPAVRPQSPQLPLF